MHPVQGAFYNDCHVLNTSSFCWHRLPGMGASPVGRHRHACSFAGGRVIVHGGSAGSHAYDNLFTISFHFGRDFNRCPALSGMHDHPCQTGLLREATKLAHPLQQADFDELFCSNSFVVKCQGQLLPFAGLPPAWLACSLSRQRGHCLLTTAPALGAAAPPAARAPLAARPTPRWCASSWPVSCSGAPPMTCRCAPRAPPALPQALCTSVSRGGHSGSLVRKALWEFILSSPAVWLIRSACGAPGGALCSRRIRVKSFKVAYTDTCLNCHVVSRTGACTAGLLGKACRHRRESAAEGAPAGC